MTGLIEVLRFLTLFCAGICAGGWVLVLAAMPAARRRFAPGPAMQLHQVTTEVIDRYMPPTTVVGIIAGILILVLEPNRPAVSTAFTAVGAASLLGAGLVSIFWNMPTNRKIAKWSTDAVPEEYRAVQQRWDTTHTLRTAFGLIALAFYIVGALAR